MEKSDLILQTKIIKLFEDFKNEAIISGGITNDKIIEDAQNQLGLKLPEQYLWFINNYGSGGLAGVRIIGISKSSKLSFVEETLQYREQGLPNQLIVIEDSDEWIECIDTTNGNIVTWSIYDKNGVVFAYNSFYEYLLDSFQEAIDNL